MRQKERPDAVEKESNEIVEKLKKALGSDGDFPVRARVVSELRSLANNPKTTISQITELILREPTLGTRILHLVNSAFYQRVQPIMTISQAVVQLGMRPLSELCTSLILLQKFVPAVKRGGIFAENMKRSIVMSLLASSLSQETADSSVAERSYLAGIFFNLGSLLLAFYFPQVFEAAEKRAQMRGHETTQSLTEIIGASPADLSAVIINSLDIPNYYLDVITDAHKPIEQRELSGPDGALVSALAAAEALSFIVAKSSSIEELQKGVSELSSEIDFNQEQLSKMLKLLPAQFSEHCKLIEMSFLSLPQCIEEYAQLEENESKETPAEERGHDPTASNNFSKYMTEIREAIRNQEPISSIITSVMETLAFSLNFDRVLLLLADSEQSVLNGKMALGASSELNPREIKRELGSTDSGIIGADIEAFQQGGVKIYGEPLFEDGWPFAAIPIGGHVNESIGVIYGDIISSEDQSPSPLDQHTEASLGILADLLDQALTFNI